MISEENKKQLENFLYNVAWLRKHYGISKKKMAEILGIGIVSLNKIEDGILPQTISINVLFNIHKHFGIPPKNQFEQRFGD